MGNKNKKLKKKKQHTLSPNEAVVLSVTDESNAPIVETEAVAHTAKNSPVEKSSQDNEEEYAYVKKDIRKILLIMLIIVVLVVALYFSNQQTAWIPKVGDWIFKILNIQTI
jgi:hypothetical protein